jgi:hypothetical protein
LSNPDQQKQLFYAGIFGESYQHHVDKEASLRKERKFLGQTIRFARAEFEPKNILNKVIIRGN